MFFTGTFFNLVIAFAVIAQVVIYRKQWHVMERSFAVGTKAYLEVHSIETDQGLVTVKVENIGQIPATKIEVACTLYAWKDGADYKASRFSMEYERLARGNFKIEFTFHLMMSFTKAEMDTILSKGMELPVFLEFRIRYYDGFKKQVSESKYGYVGRPRAAWLPFADIKWQGSDNQAEEPKEEKPN